MAAERTSRPGDPARQPAMTPPKVKVTHRSAWNSKTGTPAPTAPAAKPDTPYLCPRCRAGDHCRGDETCMCKCEKKPVRVTLNIPPELYRQLRKWTDAAADETRRTRRQPARRTPRHAPGRHPGPQHRPGGHRPATEGPAMTDCMTSCPECGCQTCPNCLGALCDCDALDYEHNQDAATRAEPCPDCTTDANGSPGRSSSPAPGPRFGYQAPP